VIDADGMTPLSRLLTFTLVILLVLAVAGNTLQWIASERHPARESTSLRENPSEAESRSANRLLSRGSLALSGLALVITVALVFSIGLGGQPGAETRAPFTAREREMRSISLLAATSAKAQEEINAERGEREKAEADSRQRLQMLNQALEEKIRIGRDLHDGVIQSLYAVGLTLESSQRLAESDPAKARQSVAQSIKHINQTISDIRAYIEGLSPRSVRGDSLASRLADEVEELRAGRPLDTDWRIDDAAVAELSDEQLGESVQIVREAVSNALRHGGAARLHISLLADDKGTTLTIRDDGTGFDLARRSAGGLGLGNMDARARSAFGAFKLTSAPGEGTSVQVTWQTAATA
jgi:signal transduction histidine kinase